MMYGIWKFRIKCLTLQRLKTTCFGDEENTDDIGDNDNLNDNVNSNDCGSDGAAAARVSCQRRR